jgi:hypothetical protein
MGPSRFLVLEGLGAWLSKMTVDGPPSSCLIDQERHQLDNKQLVYFP